LIRKITDIVLRTVATGRKCLISPMTTAPLLVSITHLGSNTALSRLDTLDIGKADPVTGLKLPYLRTVRRPGTR